MTPEELQSTVRTANLTAAAKNFVDTLHAFGVKSFIVTYALDENPEGHGMWILEGNATTVLNMLAGIIKGMRPADFKNLLASMLSGDYFEPQRQAIGIGRPAGPKKDTVN